MGFDQIKWHSSEQRRYFQAYLERIFDSCQSQVVSAAVFGSMASGENRPNSDCDLLFVVSDDCDRHNFKGQLTAIEMELLNLEQDMIHSGVDMFLSPVVLNKTGAASFNPLYLDMTTFCCIIFDKNDFLQRVLQNTREKMRQWKSQKHSIGNHWYWDIKPGTVCGEVINYDE